MIHSKLTSILAVAALSALSAGCAFESGDATEPTNTAADGLRKADSVVQLAPIAPPNGAFDVAKPITLAPVVNGDQVLSGGGTEEGPRPHPWQPVPESDSPTSDGNGNTGTAPSDSTGK
ncbi:MAG: hypothetical protein HYV09_33765 [Deltaproteobacteria bacterium]|nr:hypothetical protein [Deltaproteobacteria bacterium]